MIQTLNLSKIFKDSKKKSITALNNVSFTAEKGKITGLLGLNGAGKTTTLRIIATILSPTNGTALVEGIDVKKDPEFVRSRIGFLTGETGLYGRLTPLETLRYFGSLYDLSDSDIKKRIEEISEIFGMKNFLNRQINKLSSGMKQKVSLARTIIHNPSVLILDEPTNGLDIITRKNITDFILGNKEKGNTVLLSTHIMYEAENLCDKIIIINRGNIVASGYKNELFEHFKTNNLEEIFFSLVGREDELLQNK